MSTDTPLAEAARLRSRGGELRARLQGRSSLVHTGRVVRAVGTSLRVSGLPARIGQRCEVHDPISDTRVMADVVGIEQGHAVLVPLGPIQGIAVASNVRVLAEQASVPVGDALLGRVLDGFAAPLDGGPVPEVSQRVPLYAQAPNPLQRARIRHSLKTGVKVIDTLISVGVGQRLGIFAPAGVGKSTLLGMLATHADAEIIVVGLIGERGREVREFLEDALGAEARTRSVVIVATSDKPAMERINAAVTATAIAEGFRDQGRRVLLLMDSVTRYARAVREVGLAIGEPPVRQGFPPSVFAELPRLFERAGNGEHGSITAFYTVLTDDDDGLDPVAEETRSILDGHIVLSRKIAEQNRFPAVDVLSSLSRLFRQITPDAQQEDAGRLRQLLAKYRDIEFLLQVGEYKSGSDALADDAIKLQPMIDQFLRQRPEETLHFDQALEQLSAAIGKTSVGAGQ